MTNLHNQSKTGKGNKFWQRFGEAFMYTSPIYDFGLGLSPAEVLFLSKQTDELGNGPDNEDSIDLEGKTKKSHTGGNIPYFLREDVWKKYGGNQDGKQL